MGAGKNERIGNIIRTLKLFGCVPDPDAKLPWKIFSSTLFVLFLAIFASHIVRYSTMFAAITGLETQFAMTSAMFVWTAQCVFKLLHLRFQLNRGHSLGDGEVSESFADCIQSWERTESSQLPDPFLKRGGRRFRALIILALVFTIANPIVMAVQATGLIPVHIYSVVYFHSKVLFLLLGPVMSSVGGFVWIMSEILYLLIVGSLADAFEVSASKIREKKLNFQEFVREINLEHYRLACVARRAEAFYRSHTTVGFATNIPLVIVILYVVAVDSHVRWFVRLQTSVWALMMVFQVCSLSYAARLYSGASPGFQKILSARFSRELCTEKREPIDPGTVAGANAMINMLETDPVCLTLSGVFPISPGLVVTVASLIVTYFTVFVQFALSSSPVDCKLVLNATDPNLFQ